MPELVEATITRIGAQGDGVAETDRAMFHVPFTLAGERVRLSVDGKTATLDAILVPSPQRIEPACNHFGTCGGCQMQHLAPEAVAEFKREQVAVALAHRGFDDVAVLPTIMLPPGERRRARFAVLRIGKRVLLGFHERRNHRLVDLAACPAVLPAIGRLIAPLRDLAKRVRFEAATVTAATGGMDLMLDGKLRIDLGVREALADFAGTYNIARLTAAGETILERASPSLDFAGTLVTPPPGGFLQPSAAGEAALREQVLARIGTPKRVVDLFAGCGTFTFPLAKLAPVWAIEGDQPAIDALSRGVRGGRGLKSVTALRRDLYRRPVEAVEFDAGDTVVIDPPRDGAEAQSRTLADSPVRRIVAVSCNPATFARDARILVDAGFHLSDVQPVDQFAWSSHIELVASFER